jgi:hypothetical protein
MSVSAHGHLHMHHNTQNEAIGLIFKSLVEETHLDFYCTFFGSEHGVQINIL